MILNRTTAPPDTTDENKIIQVLLDALTNELSSEKALWIRAVITRSGDKIQGECFLNNQPWLDGLNALYWWADS